jgi:hypothetical protein
MLDPISVNFTMTERRRLLNLSSFAIAPMIKILADEKTFRDYYAGRIGYLVYAVTILVPETVLHAMQPLQYQEDKSSLQLRLQWPDTLSSSGDFSGVCNANCSTV